MIIKLQTSIVVVALSCTLSVLVGATLCWSELGPLVQQSLDAHKPKGPIELQKKGWDFWTIEIENLSNELKEERTLLRKQSEQLAQRSVGLASEEAELAKTRADVEALRKTIADKVIEITADEMKNLRTLSLTYTSLTPRAAVAIITELDDPMAVKILSLMKPDVVGAIFEQMSITKGTDGTPLARRAATLSEKLRLMKVNKPQST